MIPGSGNRRGGVDISPAVLRREGEGLADATEAGGEPQSVHLTT